MKATCIIPVIAGALALSAPATQASEPVQLNCFYGAWLLHTYDENDDGTITAEEFDAAAEEQTEDLVNEILDRYDADDDGTIATEELTDHFDDDLQRWLHRVLHAFDRNGDGAITAADKHGRGRFVLPGFLRQYDTNHDNGLSAEELDAAVDAAVADLVEDVLDKYDTNDDGDITTEELTGVVGAKVDERIDAILEKFDLNDGGDVTKEEIINVMMDWWRKLFRRR